MEAAAKHYDLVVIGAGSGGLGCGRRAATMYGKKVAMIENKVIGGTCVNVGCVPKKVMFNLASFIEDVELMKDYGVQGLDSVKVDFPTFKAKRDAYIQRLNGIYHTNVNKSGVDYFTGTASFKDSKTVVTSEGETLTGDHILIASGSYPRNPEFEGGEHCWSSDDIFTMTELPKSMIVLGGGYIAIEMAQIMQTLGCQTTMVARSKMLRMVDQELIPHLQHSAKTLGLDLRLDSPFTSVKQVEGGYALVLKDGTELVAERILSAMGRPPSVEPLKCENAGVNVSNKGAVIVDEFQNTNVPGIYAIGDVIDKVNLTPVAIRAGRILTERLFNNKPELKMCYDNIATVIFSHPPIASVGMTEEECAQKHGAENTTVHKSTFTNMFYSLANSDEKKHKTMMKLICRKENGQEKVAGLHMIGRGVDEMIQTASIAITMGATKQDFDNSVAVHPTAAEELVTMNGNLLF